jgi:hypothetical protein
MEARASPDKLALEAFHQEILGITAARARS